TVGCQFACSAKCAPQRRTIRSHLMKVYNLSCEHDHRFEGWFSSEDDFRAQSDGGQIACPVCDSNKVTSLLSAPRLNLSSASAAPADPAQQLQSQLLQFMQRVIANTEDVGERFAEEARRIHYNEAPERAIRGSASADDCRALVEEGIEVVPLP